MSTFDPHRFISYCRNALLESTPERAMREVMTRAVAEPSLRVYAGDFFEQQRSEWDSETLLKRPFDVQRTQRLFEEANRRGLE